MPAIKTTFVDITSIVPASWFNGLQKHLAGFMNLKVSISGDAVQVVGASHGGVASCYIGGEMRRNDVTVNHTFVGEASDTWNVYAVATAAVDTFAIEVSLTTPATSPYRKIAEVDWDGADITELRGVRASIEDHSHDGYAQPQIEHNDLDALTTGDPHTQYSLPDGTRAFTAPVGGITPVGATDLATKEYADSVLRTVPVGGVFWWPSADAAPSGFLLAQGAEVSRDTYDKLFALIGTTYGVGDGSTTYNLPDVRGRTILGSTDVTGPAQDDLGNTGGALLHTHTQPQHAHVQDAHVHTAPTHFHTGVATGSGGAHVHTQANTGSVLAHDHAGPSHTHGASGLTATGAGAAIVGGRQGTGTDGLYPRADLDNSSSGTSHAHGSGSYFTVSPVHSVSGTSSSASKSHTHQPTGNPNLHTHNSGSVSGATALEGTGLTGTGGVHDHGNPDLASGGAHTHPSGGNTGTAAAAANSGGDVATGLAGDEVTGASLHPYLAMNAIIRFE